MKPKLKKQLSTIFKIAVSAGLIGLVFSKLDWNQISSLLKTANSLYFGLAIALFIASQLVSALRFDVFIRKIGIRLDFWTNVRLYLLGMFYNFFLPGGVGGDAYKVFLLKQSHHKPLKKIGEIVFADRLVGLVAIGFLISILIVFVPTSFSLLWNFGITVIGFLTTGVILQWISHYLHSRNKRIYIVFAYSILVQLLQLGCVFLILKSFQIETDYSVYLLLFLTSSVLSVVSFAGIGIREAVFFYGAGWFNFNAETSASVALSFSIFTAIVSFIGIVYIFKKIKLKNG